MIGLANMAARLAYARRGNPKPRNLAAVDVGWIANRGDSPGAFPASAEYYRIIDRITRGEKP